MRMLLLSSRKKLALRRSAALSILIFIVGTKMNVNGAMGGGGMRKDGEVSKAVPESTHYQGDTDTLIENGLPYRSKIESIAVLTKERKKPDDDGNEALLRAASTNSTTHQWETSEKIEEEKYNEEASQQGLKRQRVVILPGPHKTGTTSMQECLAEWTTPTQKDDTNDEPVIKDWAWPVVEETTPYGPGKAYIGLYFELVGREPRFQDPSEERLKPLYEDLFLDAWLNGKSIVFGTEAFDFLLANKLMGDHVIDQILSMMPWKSPVHPPLPPIQGSSDDIVVSITYRVPRAKQLVSLWHEIGHYRQSLSEFIVALPSDSDQWLCLNPLGLVNAFVEKGLNVVIIDSSGLKRDGLDISHVVACEVLNVPCANNKVVGAPKQDVISNKGHGRGEVDLHERQLAEIEKILNDFDKSYCHLSTNPKVQTLHAEHLFSLCDGHAGDGGDDEWRIIDTFSEAMHLIKEVAIQVTGQEFAQLKVNCGQHRATHCFFCPFRIWHQEGGFVSPCAGDCKMCDTGHYGEVCIPSNEPCQFMSEGDIAAAEGTDACVGGNECGIGDVFDRQHLPDTYQKNRNVTVGSATTSGVADMTTNGKKEAFKEGTQASLPTNSQTTCTSSEETAHRASNNEDALPPTYHQRNERQRVVVLPGPHKTGTTSMQECLAEWTTPTQNDNETEEPIIKDWTWPVVQEATPYGPGKAYIGLYFELVGREPRFQDPSERKLQPLYEDLFLNAWSSGKNIVFGTEAFDYLLADKQMGDYVIDQILSMMPWKSPVHPPLPPIHGSSNDIVVSITYRAPRAKQLVSLWHEIGFDGQSLSEFIVALPSDSDQWLCLNPLGLANAFVEKGLNVVIIDSSGVKRIGLDISHVVACEVLNVPCANNKVIGASKQYVTSNKGHGRGDVDLNDEQLDTIEKILNDFDKSYCHLSTNSKVKVLHSEQLFSSCAGRGKEDHEAGMNDSLGGIIDRIKQVATQVTGQEYAQLEVNCGEHYAIDCFFCPFRIWHQEGGFHSPCAADCQMCDTGYYGEVCISANEPCKFISEEETDETGARIVRNEGGGGVAFDRHLPKTYQEYRKMLKESESSL